MRNVIQYPLTPGEILDALTIATADQAEKGLIGGIDGYALFILKKYLIDNPDVLLAMTEKAKD